MKKRNIKDSDISPDVQDSYEIDNCIEFSDFAKNGLCPCCGNEVRTKGGNYDDSEMSDYCEYCHWEGHPYYG